MVLESAIATPAIALNQIVAISLTTALLIAASLSATDPVSLTSLFRELGVDSRLVTLIGRRKLNWDSKLI